MLFTLMEEFMHIPLFQWDHILKVLVFHHHLLLQLLWVQKHPLSPQETQIEV
uniref:G-box-binding factor 3-like isoform X4 n=1 Tax=Rhizophora mucronata TaxID=61149 RepID=A0A2P2M302_RHIMU